MKGVKATYKVLYLKTEEKKSIARKRGKKKEREWKSRAPDHICDLSFLSLIIK